MRKVYMQNSHYPEQNEWGDCLRACVASLFEREPENVPHFGEGGPDATEMWRRVQLWLANRHAFDGHEPLRTWITVFPGEAELPDILSAMKALNGDAFYLVGGTTNAGGDHIVVAQGDRIVHDPSRMGSGIQGPASDGFFHIVTFVRDFA